MKTILSRQVLFLFILAATLLIFSAGLCYRAVRVLSDHQYRVNRTYEVLGNLEAAKGMMWLAERDERNYVITGQEQWMEGYADASKRLWEKLDTIGEMTRDNPAQRQRLVGLRDVVARRMRSLDDAIAAFRRGGLEASRARIVEGSGPQLMEQAVGIIDQVEKDESALLAAHSAESGEGLKNLVLIFSLLSLLSVALLGLIFITIRREMHIRNEAERRVRRSETQLLLAIEAAELGVWEWDLSAPSANFSDRFMEMFRLPVTRERPLRREDFLNRMHPEDVPKVMESVERSKDPTRSGEYCIVYRVIWPDGEIRSIRAQGRTIFDGNGANRRPVRMVGTVQDITEQKRAEDDLLRAKDEAERAAKAALDASRAKDQFLAVLSHELRTPLTPVLASAWEMEQHPDLPEGLREDIATVRRNVELEARLIDDLLDLTRISRGKIRLHPEVVDLHALVGGVTEMFAGTAAEKGLRMTRELTAERHDVWGDAGRLQQVLWNLLSNAVKFTPDGGAVVIRTRDEADGRICLEVADTGIGIPPEALPRLFNAFEQAEQSISRKYGGLGLGLSIAKAIADLHGAELEACSEGVGRGAIFRLRIKTVVPAPTPVASPPSELAAPPSGNGKQKLRILLVEDNEDTRRLMERLLRTFGHEVRSVGDVAGAIQAARQESFDLLLSDIGLPDGTGWELMRRLGERRPAKAIALSGFSMEEDLRKSREAGFVEHITKPVNITALRETIDRVKG